MRKMLWLALAFALGAQAALAGGPPGRREGDRREGDRREGDRPRFDMFRGGDFSAPRTRGNAFDALRRYFDLTPEQQAAVAKLDEQRAADEREAMTALAKSLDKKYAALIVEALPADQKAKYEQVLAALAARDEARDAAEKEFRAVLDKARADQGMAAAAPRRGPAFFGTGLPNGKTDIVRQYINLTEQQRGAVDGIQRDTWGNIREQMDRLPRADWRDPKAADARRKLREQLEAQAAEAMLLLLNDEQKKAYQTAAAALDTYDKKVTEADDACEKKLIELVGAEKAKAMRAGWWQFPPIVQPGGPPPKGGEAPKATEF
ncbi:MAG: hypothetical protein FJ290_13475 [Planctomycetes bacterium]|nr:hypothetical protein [Planctomycetota bacterium]